MPVHFPSELVRRQRPRTVEVMAGHPIRCAWDSFSAMRNPGVDQNFTDLAAVVQLRLRVALGLQTLTVKSRLLINRRELGANPRRPTISASVVKLLSSSASNGEFAGGSPAGCTNSRRVSPTTRGAPLRTERLGVELPHAAPISIFSGSSFQAQ